MRFLVGFIVSVSFASSLKADVDLSRLPATWQKSESPEALLAQAKQMKVEHKGFFTSQGGQATLTYNFGKPMRPYTPEGNKEVLEGISKGFGSAAEKAGVPLTKNEVVEVNGVSLLHQEFLRNGQVSLTLNQITPTGVEQVMVICPAEGHEAVIKEVYGIFLPVAAPTVAGSPASPSPASGQVAANENGAAYKFGMLMGRILFIVFAIGIVLTAFGVMKFSRRKPKADAGQ